MSGKLKRYQLTLKTQGPVFIGSGAELNKKEYVISDDKKSVLLLDMNKFWMFMARYRGMQESFEKFIMSGDGRNLEKWLADEYRIKPGMIAACVRDTIPAGSGRLNPNSKFGIKDFIRDPYGFPYVPGSSLKGMLRTILLTDRIANHSSEWEEQKKAVLSAEITGKKRDFSREQKSIETQAFNTLTFDKKKKENAVNDLLRYLIVGDSKPIPRDRLVICDKIDVRADNRDPTAINMSRVCIRPETNIQFDLTIDEGASDLSAAAIMRAVNVFDECYQKYFLDSFWSVDSLTENQVFLGGGAGFVSKTILYPLLGKEQGTVLTSKILTSQFSKAPKNKNDATIYKVSPHMVKMTYCDGKMYPFGLCHISIRENM